VPLSILRDPRLKVMLPKIDEDLAEQARKGGCPRCRGRLDGPPIPRGLLVRG
jgi:hypothetical protein